MTTHIAPEPPEDAAIPDAMIEAIAALALDALPPDEEPRTLAYLAAHPAARALLDEYREIVMLFPYTTARNAPPATLRSDVLRALPRRAPRLPAPRIQFAGWSWWARGLAACLVLGLCLWNITLQTRLANRAPDAAPFFSTPGLVAFELRPDASTSHASGRMYLTPDRQQAGLAVSGLPSLPPDHTYQLWFRLNDQSRMSVTTFVPDTRGTALLVLPAPPASIAAISCGITEEPRGGSATPTGPRVLASGEWSTADVTAQ